MQRQADNLHIDAAVRATFESKYSDWQSAMSDALALLKAKTEGKYQDTMAFMEKAKFTDPRLDDVRKYLVSCNAETITAAQLADLKTKVDNIEQVFTNKLQQRTAEHQDEIKLLQYNHSQAQDNLRISSEKEISELRQRIASLELTNNHKQEWISTNKAAVTQLKEEHEKQMAHMEQRTKAILEEQEQKVATLEDAKEQASTQIEKLRSYYRQHFDEIKVLKSTIAQHEKQEKRMQLQLVGQKEQFEKQIDDLRSEKDKSEQILVRMEAGHRQRIADFQSKDTAHRKRIARLEDKLNEAGGHGLTVDNRLTWVSSHLDMIDLFSKSGMLANRHAHFVAQAKNRPDVKDRMEATRRTWILGGHMRRVIEGRDQFISAMKAAREVAPLTGCEAGASDSPAGVVSDPEGTRDSASGPHDGATNAISSDQEKLEKKALAKQVLEYWAKVIAETPSVEEGEGESSWSEPVDVETRGEKKLEQTPHGPSSFKRGASLARGNSPKHLKSVEKSAKPLSSNQVQALTEMNICAADYNDQCKDNYCSYVHLDRRIAADLLGMSWYIESSRLWGRVPSRF